MSSEVDSYTVAVPPGTSHLITERTSTGEQGLRLDPTPSADPNEPLNWSPLRKFINYALVLIVTLVIFTGLSIQIIFWQLLAPELKADFQQLNNSQSINSAGLTVGCVFFIPFAIKYGRRPVYIISTAIIFAMSVWSSRMTTVWELYVTNLLMGLAGATNEAIVGLTVADLFFVHQRGTMNGFYLIMVMTGSFLTPLISGVQATAQGWRWCYYVLSICTGVILLMFILFFEETKYVPAIEGLEANRTRSQDERSASEVTNSKSPHVEQAAEVPADELRSRHLDTSIPSKTWRQRLIFITPTNESLWRVFCQPIVALFSFPAVAFAAIEYGAGLSWLVNMSVAVSVTFSQPPYSFKPAEIGYMGVGPFIGNLLGSIYCGYLADRAVVWFSKRNHGWFESEMRLYLLHLPSLAISSGLIVFGCTTARGMHWIYPSIGGALFGFGLGAFGDTVLTYVIDSYRLVTGESFVAIAFVRNVFGIVIGQVRTPWMKNMGVQNMFILQGVLALVIALLYIPMIYFGKAARVTAAPRYRRMVEHKGAHQT